jgi:hypothetical protein
VQKARKVWDQSKIKILYFLYILILYESGYSSGRATRSQAVTSNESYIDFRQGLEIYLLYSAHHGSVAHTESILCFLRAMFPAIDRLTCKADQLTHHVPHLRMNGSIPPLSHIHLLRAFGRLRVLLLCILVLVITSFTYARRTV